MRTEFLDSNIGNFLNYRAFYSNLSNLASFRFDKDRFSTCSTSLDSIQQPNVSRVKIYALMVLSLEMQSRLTISTFG